MDSKELDRTNQIILDRLRHTGSSPLSGEALAHELGLSRVALWKRMEALKEWGCVIRSSHQGYSLVEEDLLIPAPAQDRLAAPDQILAFPGPVHWRPQVGSTMDEAWEAVRKGAPHGTLVMAELQQNGRGQQGRPWQSPGGGLYASLILVSPLPQAWAGTLVLEAGTILCKYLQEKGLQVQFQWPGDLMAGTRKLGGLLIESRGSPDRPGPYVLGLGINKEAPALSEKPMTGLKDLTPHPPSRKELVALVARHLHTWAATPELTPLAWASHSNLVGRTFAWTDWKGNHGKALCTGFDDAAGLVASTRVFRYGETTQISIEN